MRKILTERFFERPAPEVAKALLGKYLLRKEGDREEAYMITETEAYEGEDDLASHASKGRTQRTSVMFGKAGIFYIYLVYGMYRMLNIVTGKEEHPSAVLIRSVKGITGPGRLTGKLDIGMGLNKMPALPVTGLWFEDRGERTAGKDIKTSARIGVAYAGPVWSKKPWRFVLDKEFKGK